VGADAPAVAQGVHTSPAGVPGGGLIEKFDNWEVRRVPGQNSFLLVGYPSDNSGQLWLMCEHKSYLTVAVSMTGRGGRKGVQKSQVVKLQVDNGSPRDFNFLVFESFVAIATESAGTTDERVGAFLVALRDVKNSLVLTYDDTSHAFDVSHLPKARQRFLRLCGRMPA
jgi:hypothetical protein